MDLALFRIRAFAASVGAALLNFYGIASVLILVPFFLVEARGLSTLQAGYALAAFSVAMAATAVLSGWLTGRVSPRTLMLLGITFSIAGMALLATMSVETSIAGVIWRLIITGAGRGLFEAPSMTLVMGAVSHDRLGTASASSNTSRAIGTSVGIAGAGAILATRAASFAEARSPAGLDDPLVRPEAFMSGIELALLVGIAFAIAALVAAGFAIPPNRS